MYITGLYSNLAQRIHQHCKFETGDYTFFATEGLGYSGAINNFPSWFNRWDKELQHRHAIYSGYWYSGHFMISYGVETPAPTPVLLYSNPTYTGSTLTVSGDISGLPILDSATNRYVFKMSNVYWPSGQYHAVAIYSNSTPQGLNSLNIRDEDGSVNALMQYRTGFITADFNNSNNGSVDMFSPSPSNSPHELEIEFGMGYANTVRNGIPIYKRQGSEYHAILNYKHGVGKPDLTGIQNFNRTVTSWSGLYIYKWNQADLRKLVVLGDSMNADISFITGIRYGLGRHWVVHNHAKGYRQSDILKECVTGVFRGDAFNTAGFFPDVSGWYVHGLKDNNVLIRIGVNDLRSGVSGQTIINNISGAISSIRQDNPGWKIHLMPVTMFSGQFQNTTYAAAEPQRIILNTSVLSGALSGMVDQVIDIENVFFPASARRDGVNQNGKGYTGTFYPGYCRNPLMFGVDTLHNTKSGANLVAEYVCSKLSPAEVQTGWYFRSVVSNNWSDTGNWFSRPNGYGINPTAAPWTTNDSSLSKNIHLVSGQPIINVNIGSGLTIVGSSFINGLINSSGIFGGNFLGSSFYNSGWIYGGTFGVSGFYNAGGNISGGVWVGQAFSGGGEVYGGTNWPADHGGCTDAGAENYDSEATWDDGSCLADASVYYFNNVNTLLGQEMNWSELNNWWTSPDGTGSHPPEVPWTSIESAGWNLYLGTDMGPNFGSWTAPAVDIPNITGLGETDIPISASVNVTINGGNFYGNVTTANGASILAGFFYSNVYNQGHINGGDFYGHVYNENGQINNDQPNGPVYHNGGFTGGGTVTGTEGGWPADLGGCMDSNATNYNPDATWDDASCTYDP